MQEGQLAGALQYRIEHPDEPGETSVLIFGLNPNPQITAKGQDIRSLLRLRPELKEIRVFYGGYAGKDDEIDLATRSMLQIMLEFSSLVRVPAEDVALDV